MLRYFNVMLTKKIDGEKNAKYIVVRIEEGEDEHNKIRQVARELWNVWGRV